MDEEVPHELIWDDWFVKQRCAWISSPSFMGSAYKNKGVQNLLDAVTLYLPSPRDREVVTAFDVDPSKETPKFLPIPMRLWWPWRSN
jgi:elongation factor G